MLINYYFILATSFLVGLALVRLFKNMALKQKILMPQGIPLTGGAAISISWIFSCLVIFFIRDALSQPVTGIIIASLIKLSFGLNDDVRELSIKRKILAQLIAAAVLVLFGIRTQIANIGLFPNLIITFIWVLAITNAFNHLDVMDGLAAGTAMISAASFFIICLLNGDLNMGILTLALFAILAAFLIYNLPPAKVYMGNSGSHFLGFVLAAIAIAISYAPSLERKVSLLSPLLILGFPIFDTLFLVLIRLGKKKLPFMKSRDHLALRFLTSGFSKPRALSYMLAFALLFSLCGIAVSQVSNLAGGILIVLVILMSIVLAIKMSKVVVNA